eukprot:TRINITY_DN40027_c0_g1_i1.p1 TRINITY_DN40027_c0_g1~~TRINITY_DN40027_c0_g1_i1.p1  ORF type:complete len:482 (-),score=48.15 TRINITY_DN40027_c0_g1_i1:101-1546(-)
MDFTTSQRSEAGNDSHGSHGGARVFDDCAAHKAYLTKFLSNGFAALEQLRLLDHENGGSGDINADSTHVRPALPGFGCERAAKLLGACNAEPALLSAVYWVICAFHIIGHPLPHELVGRATDLVLSCRRGGGFAPHPEHEDRQLLSTLSAVQVLLLLGRSDLLLETSVSCVEGNTESSCTGCLADDVEAFVLSLQLRDGSFVNREGVDILGRVSAGEGDCRFVYAALNTLALVQSIRPGASVCNSRESSCDKVIEWILRCQNLDGGFGCRPDGECESHAGHTFCCLAALALVGGLGQLPVRGRARLVRWFGDRQCCDAGQGMGLNGRPGKAADACYTWWTLASAELCLNSFHEPKADGACRSATKDLSMLFQLAPLRDFLISCCGEKGGIAAHPGDDPDPFHTFFGLSGASLLDWDVWAQRNARGRSNRGEIEAGTSSSAACPEPQEPWLRRMCPAFALPRCSLPLAVISAIDEGRPTVCL